MSLPSIVLGGIEFRRKALHPLTEIWVIISIDSISADNSFLQISAHNIVFGSFYWMLAHIDHDRIGFDR